MFKGILLVDKPKSWTSFDVVAKVRSILHSSSADNPKIGHTGTLDPLATGLIVLLVGDYTKKASELSKLDKVYDVTMKLGETSTTGDEEGDKTKISDEGPSHGEIEAVLEKFTGELVQTPPQHSAIKINGQRAYQIARQGGEIELQPRQVKVYENKLTDYAYPYVKFTSQVSSGTYIRSLVADMGKQLGVGAYMSDLRRTKVGQFDLVAAIEIQNLTTEIIYKNLLSLPEET